MVKLNPNNCTDRLASIRSGCEIYSTEQGIPCEDETVTTRKVMHSTPIHDESVIGLTLSSSSCANSGIVPELANDDPSEGEWTVVRRKTRLPIRTESEPQRDFRSRSDLDQRRISEKRRQAQQEYHNSQRQFKETRAKRVGKDFRSNKMDMDFDEPSASCIDYHYRKVSGGSTKVRLVTESLYSFRTPSPTTLSEGWSPEKVEYMKQVPGMNVELGVGTLPPIPDTFAAQFKVFEDNYGLIPVLREIVAPTAALAYQLYRSRNCTDVAVAVYCFVDWTKVQVALKTLELAKLFVDKYVNLLVSHMNSWWGIVTESFIDDLEDAGRFFSMSTTSELFSSIRDLVLNVTSLRVFGKVTAGRVFQYLGKPEAQPSFLTAIHEIFKSVIVLLRIGEKAYECKSISSIFLSENPAATVMERIAYLLKMEENLYVGLPVQGKMCIRTFVKNCVDMRETGEQIMKSSSPFSPKFKALRASLESLDIVEGRVRARLRGTNRAMPLGLVVHGFPGVGKGKVMNFLFSIYSKVKERRFEQSLVYTRNKDSEYYEGLDPVSQPYLKYTEVGNDSLGILKSKGDPIISELCTMCDTQPYPVNMAFGDKGKTFIFPEVVMIDSNNKGLNLDHLVQNPAAVRRRFFFVGVQVKSQFLQESGVGLDSRKAVASGNPLNVWKFTVESYVPKSNRDSFVVSHHSGNDMTPVEDFIADFEAVIRKHLSEQDDVKIFVDSAINALTSQFSNTPAIISESEPSGLNSVGAVWDSVPVWTARVTAAISYNVVKKGALKLRAATLSARDALMNQMPSHIPERIIRPWYMTIYNLFMGMLLHVFCNVAIFSFSFLLWAVNPWLSFKSGSVFVGTLYLAWSSPRLSLLPLLFLFLMITMQNRLLKYFTGKIIVSTLKEFRVYQAARVKFWWGEDTPNPSFSSVWWANNRVAVVSAAATVGSLLAVYHYLGKKTGDKQCTEPLCEKKTPTILQNENLFSHDLGKDSGDATEFKLPSEHNEDLNERERLMGCGTAFERVKVKNSPIWNTRDLMPVTSPHTGTASDLYHRLIRNLRHVKVLGRDVGYTYVTGIRQNVAFINKHAIPTEFPFEIQVAQVGKDVRTSSHVTRVMVSAEDVWHVREDIVMIRLRGVQFVDNSKHLSSHSLRGSNFKVVAFGKECVARGVNQPCSITTPFGEEVWAHVIAYVFKEHVQGICGAPLVVTIGTKHYWAAIHAAGGVGSELAYASIIPSEEVETLLSANFTAGFQIYSQAEYANFSLGPAIPQSVFRYECFDRARYLGKLPNCVLINKKSRLHRRTLGRFVNEFFESKGHVPKTLYGKPVMQPKFVDGVYVSPYNLGVRSMNTTAGCVHLSVLRTVVATMTTRAVREFRRAGLHRLAPWTFEVAINGSLDDGYARRINVATAAGFDLVGKKSAYLYDVYADGSYREPVHILKERVQSIFQAFERGLTAEDVYVISLKDEPRALDKVAVGKTRLFCIGSVPMLVVCRQLLGPIFSSIAALPSLFGTAIGINMHVDSHELITSMSADGWVFLAGDFSTYDWTLPYDIRATFNEVLYNVARDLGYGERALSYLSALLSTDLFPTISMLEDLFVLPGAQPSGKYGTAETNSGSMQVILLCIWFSDDVLKTECPYDHIRWSNYGDDLFISVSPWAYKRLDNFVIRDYCGSVLNMKYTPSVKDGEMLRSETREQVSFLRRRFVYRDSLNRWLAPLDLDSITRAFEWTIPSDCVSEIDQLLSTTESALYEVYMHYEERDYEEFRQFIESRIISEHGKHVSMNFPTYKELTVRLFGD